MQTEYPKGFFYIQLYFAKKVSILKDISLEKAIIDYTNIATDLLKIDKYPPDGDDLWKAMLSPVVKKAMDEKDIDSLMNLLFEFYLALPHAKWNGNKPKSKYGMFSYGFYPDASTINLHAGNIHRGEKSSSFSEKYFEENKENLYKMIHDVKSKFPNVKMVTCSSWILRIENFIGLFPLEFRESLVVKPNKNFLGIWQQFLDKDGGYKESLGEVFMKVVDAAKTMDESRIAFPNDVLSGRINIEIF